MVGVDETGQEDVTGEVEDFVGFAGQAGSLPYLLDNAVANKKTTIREFGLAVVEGEQVGVFDE
jgi:hypothetical protein